MSTQVLEIITHEKLTERRTDRMIERAVLLVVVERGVNAYP